MGPGAVPEFLTPSSEVPLEHFQIAQNLFPLIYKLPQGWKVCSLFRKLLNNRNEWAQWMFSCCSFLKSINFYDLYWHLQPSLFYDLMVFYPNLFYSSVVFKVSSNPSHSRILCSLRSLLTQAILWSFYGSFQPNLFNNSVIVKVPSNSSHCMITEVTEQGVHPKPLHPTAAVHALLHTCLL